MSEIDDDGQFGSGQDPQPWLLDLATPQRGGSGAVGDAYYDDATQMSYLQEPHIPVIDSGSPQMTKKADREVGEDQKV